MKLCVLIIFATRLPNLFDTSIKLTASTCYYSHYIFRKSLLTFPRSSVVSWSLPSAELASTSVCSSRFFQSLPNSHISPLLTKTTGRSPTKSTSETPVTISSRPWEGEGEGKYKYHPGGDLSKEPKDAPSALNVVVVPNVTLPAELHEKYNKWGKEGYP